MKISIITVVLNQAIPVRKALDSLVSQSFADWELIVIDGGSTDGTLEVLDAYRNRITHLVSEPDKGIYDALNKGLRLASGEVVGFLHSDDRFASPDALKKVHALFEATGADGVYGELEYVSRKEPARVIRSWKSRPFSPGLLQKGWMPPHPAFFIKRKWYTTHGLFDTQYTISGDYELMLRFLKIPEFRAVYLPVVLVRMSTGGISNRSLKSIWTKSMEDLEIIRRHGLGGWGTLFWKNFSKIRQF
ncbi:MAG: glycosyltransferase family 2 protein [Bacteroidales bacterium]